MARLTQRPEVAGVVGAAVFEREDVVDFLRRRVPASREAVLTQGVGGDVGGADLAPAGTVSAVDLRVTLPPPVPFVLRFRMLRAEAGVGEVRAAGLGTRTRRLRWHVVPPVPGHGAPYLNPILLSSSNTNVRKEANEIRYNMPKAFSWLEFMF